MMLDKYNQKMKPLLDAAVEITSNSFPIQLKNLLNAGLLEVNGCVLLKALFISDHTTRQHFPDDTGYECFVNHIHMDDHFENHLVSAAIAFLGEVSRQLKREFTGRKFTGILSVNGPDCSVRFCEVRSGEQWFSDDLEGYKEDGVCIFTL